MSNKNKKSNLNDLEEVYEFSASNIKNDLVYKKLTSLFSKSNNLNINAQDIKDIFPLLKDQNLVLTFEGQLKNIKKSSITFSVTNLDTGESTKITVKKPNILKNKFSSKGVSIIIQPVTNQNTIDPYKFAAQIAASIDSSCDIPNKTGKATLMTKALREAQQEYNKLDLSKGKIIKEAKKLKPKIEVESNEPKSKTVIGRGKTIINQVKNSFFKR